MNNEPVAWMETYKGEPNNLDWDKSNLNYGSEFHDVIPLYTHQYERPHNTVLVPCDKLAEMQAEIEALKAGKIRAYDNGVEDGRKPNTNLVKELTDDKIADLIKATNDEIGMKNIRTFDFTKVLLRKASEK